MIWEPLNLTSTCPAVTELTACSQLGFVYLNLLVQLYGGSIEPPYQRESLCEEKLDRGNDGKYDFIVVGGGTAGCIVSSRLTENPNWTVLLIEAGPEQPEVTIAPSLSTAIFGSNIDWQYKTQPNGKSCLARAGGQCDWPRGKVMGGSSSINSMSYIRGNMVDFDNWAKLGNPGWSYKEVLPFFKKSERNLDNEGLDRKYHGVDGLQPVSRYPYIDMPSRMLTEAFHEKGLPFTDYNAAHQQGTSQAQAFSKNGERVSAYSAFIQPFRYKRNNLIIKTESEVLKIHFKGKRAIGVTYQYEDQTYEVYAKKEVIISAGTINSPKLLMLSGIGPKEHLESLNIPVIKNLAVGENLHDHVTFNGMIIALPNRTVTSVDQDQMLDEVYEYGKMRMKEGPMSSNGPVNSIAFLESIPGLIAPDVQYQVSHLTYWREYLSEPILYEKVSFFPTPFYDGIVPRGMNVVVKSRGYLLLNASDPNGSPLIYPNYLDKVEDYLPLIRGAKFLMSLEDTKAFKLNGAKFVKDPLPACVDYEWGSDEYIRCLARSYTSSTYHPVGTCKMGPKSDKKAVVNNKLRVYGVKGLLVIDASIMPVVIRGNTNAPTMMIAERAVCWLIEYWKRLEKQ